MIRLLVALALLLAATALLALHLRTVRRRIAELERRSRALEHLADRAGIAERTLSALIGHDLRTPLSTIIGYQELLAEGICGAISEQGRQAVARIGVAAEQLLQLIDAVSEVARLDADPAPQQPVAVDVGTIVARALESTRSLAIERGVTLDNELPADPPPFSTDSDRLGQALALALAAAIRASGGNRLRIHVVTGPAGVPAFEIAGTRLGLDAVDAARDRARSPGSADLRLSLAARLLASLGGTLSLRPAGNATTLHLRLADPTLPPD